MRFVVEGIIDGITQLLVPGAGASPAARFLKFEVTRPFFLISSSQTPGP